MKTRCFTFVTTLALVLAGNTIHAQTVVWTNTASSVWNAAANWSPNTIPNSNNTAIINMAGVTVSLNGATTAGAIILGTNSGGTVTLSLNSQTLTMYGPLTVNASGSFTVDSGVLIGSTNVQLSGTIGWTAGELEGGLTLSGGSTLNITGTTLDMPGCIFTNNGTVVWTNGTIQAGSGTVIYNHGLWNMQSDQILNDAFGGGATFNNYGTVRKSGGAGEFANASIFASGIVFNQLAGVIDVQNGIGTNGTQLALQGGGSLTGGYITTNQYGLTVLSSGSFTVNGTVTGTNTWEDAGNLVGKNVINGALTWVGGTWNSATSVTITPTATLLIVGGTGVMDMDACQVTNNGTVLWTNGTIQSGNGSVIDNYGLWNMQSDQTMNNAYGGVGAIFNNYGTLRKSGGVSEFTNATIFASGVVFNQVAGVIDVQNGTNGLELAFEGGGTFTGGYITTNQYGLTVLSEGSFTINGTVTGTNTWEDTGNLIGANVINGNLTWVGGDWNGAASVTITPNSTLLIVGTGDLDIEGCQMTNNGTVVWTNGTIQAGSGTVIYNNGLWNMQSDQTLSDAYGGSGTVFNNFGTLRKSGGQSEFTSATVFGSGVVFNQLAGVIDVQNGTNGLELELEGGGHFAGGYITTNQFGLTDLAEGSFTLNGTVTGTNTWDDGGVMAGVNVINGAFTWVYGSWNNSVFTVTTNSTLIINTPTGNHLFAGVIFTNNGTVNWSGDRLYGGGGAAFYNYGLWNAQDDHILDNNYGGAGTVFNNYGTFRKSGGANTNQTELLSVTFNQISGVVDVQTGNLMLAGTENFTGGSTTSTGTIYLSTGNFTVNGSTTTSNVVDNPGTMVGNNVINGALTWQYGSWNNSVVTVATNSTLFINTASGNHLFGGVTCTNNGTVNWSGDRLYGGGGTAVYNNGVWNALDDHVMDNNYGGAGTVFNNYGTFLKSGGAGTNQTELQSITFNQISGFIQVQTGLNLVLAGIENFTGGYDTNTGTTWLSTGSFTINGTVTSSNVVDNPGNMAGVNVINGALTWQYGSWSAVAVTVATNSVLYINTASGNHLLDDCAFTNNGTVNWRDDTLYGGNSTAFYNYGLWNAQDDHILNNNYGGAGTVFANFGIFRKTGTSGGSSQIQTGVTFTNTGTLDSQAGNISLQGTCNLTNGTLNFGLNALTNFGTISLAGAASLTGTASANLNGGYVPVEGNSFAVLSFGSKAGIFTSTNLPFADAWSTNYTTTNFSLLVLNARPTLICPATQSVNELTLLTATNTATDPDQPPQTLTFALVSGPSGMAINSGTGVITWTPPQTNSPSTNTITVSVTDNGAPPLSATNSFTVIVKEVNMPPTLLAAGGQTVDVLALLTVTNLVTETNIHSTTAGFALIAPPTGAGINSNGVFTWMPGQAQGPATNTITVVVTNFNPYDMVNPNLTATNSFQVIVYAPTIATPGEYIVNVGQTVSFTASAHDNDSTRTLSFSLGVAPPGATITSGGLFNWRPPVSSANTISATHIQVTANSTPADTVAAIFDIKVNPLTPVTLTPVSKTDTQFEVQVAGPVGPDYILQGTKSLSPTNWLNIQTNTPAASPFDITTTNVTMTNEYYRIQLGP